MSHSRHLKKGLLLAAAGGWTAAIPLLSLVPPSMMPSLGFLGRIPHVDKWIHAGIYGLQTVLFIATWQAFRPGARWRGWAGLALASSLYGLLMEVLQRRLTEVRTFSWGDVAANAAGALLAVVVAVAVSRFDTHRTFRRP